MSQQAGDLQVKVGGNSSGFNAVLNDAKAAGNKFAADLGKSWSGAFNFGNIAGGLMGFLGFSAIKSSFDSFLNKANEIRDLSEQLGMAANETQRWEKAASKLGLSFSGLQSVLTNIQQKRMDALTDPKVAALFERLGISRKTVLDTEGTGQSDFARMVLGAGGKSASADQALVDLISVRGKKYAAAAKKFDESTANLDDSAIEAAHKAEEAQRKFKGLFTRMWSDMVSGWVDASDDVKRGKIFAWKTDNIQGPFARRGLKNFPKDSSPITDPLVAAQQAKDLEYAEKVYAIEDRMNALKRETMSIDDRKRALGEEIYKTLEKIAPLEVRRGKLTEDELIKLGEYQIKYLSLQNELTGLNKFKPENLLRFSASAGGKSGLFGASDIIGASLYNTHINIMREQLNTQRRMERHLSKLTGQDAF